MNRDNLNQKSKLDLVLNKLDSLNDDIKFLKSDVSVLKRDVSVLKTDISTLKIDMNDLKSTVGMLWANFIEIDKKVGFLVDYANKDIDKNEQYEVTLKNHDERIQKLEVFVKARK